MRPNPSLKRSANLRPWKVCRANADVSVKTCPRATLCRAPRSRSIDSESSMVRSGLSWSRRATKMRSCALLRLIEEPWSNNKLERTRQDYFYHNCSKNQRFLIIFSSFGQI